MGLQKGKKLARGTLSALISNTVYPHASTQQARRGAVLSTCRFASASVSSEERGATSAAAMVAATCHGRSA
eukprot:6183767-Pleurochrysis_carterae.AAC.7